MSDPYLRGLHAAINTLWREYRKCIRAASKHSRGGYSHFAQVSLSTATDIKQEIDLFEAEIQGTK